MRVVDLFCGCGGLSLGFLRAGMDIVASYDNWDSAIAVYNANFIHEAVKLDLSDEVVASDSISRNNPDMIIGDPLSGFQQCRSSQRG